MSTRRVMIVGAHGQLGDAVCRVFADWDRVLHTHQTLDVTDPKAVASAVADASPAVVVNCAAFNDVDGAEDRPEAALAVNAFAVRSLARAADACGAVLVHYGTDFVFDGTATVFVVSPGANVSVPATGRKSDSAVAVASTVRYETVTGTVVAALSVTWKLAFAVPDAGSAIVTSLTETVGRTAAA